jgi:uncharacterized protein (TIGR03437 family)
MYPYLPPLATGLTDEDIAAIRDIYEDRQPTISVSPSLLQFAYRSGGNLPPAQTVAVTASPALTFTAVASGGSWPTVSPTSGVTPAYLSVSVNPAGLTPGTYNGTVTVAAAGASNSRPTVVVMLVVGSATPSIGRVLNGASSFASNAFAPGSIVSIFGIALGPNSGISMNIKPDHTVNTVLAGFRVLFDGYPAPLLFAQSSQINAIVPFEVAGRSKVRLQVESQGKLYDSVDIPMTRAAPGLFTSSASGVGHGAILNQDYTVNSVDNPASKGSVIILYGTGGGIFDRSIPDGAIVGTESARLALPASIQIDGVDGKILYAGSAPGLVAGVIQVNVKLPEQIRSGNVPIILTVGTYASQLGVTVAVR